MPKPKIHLNSELVSAFYLLSEKKILHEKWAGRNTQIKIDNFALCWISEHAMQEMLARLNIKYAYTGMFVGPVEYSPKSDFIVWKKGVNTTIGLRSRKHEALMNWREVPYPDDRLRLEKGIISDYTVVSSIEISSKRNAEVLFWGAINRDSFFRNMMQPDASIQRTIKNISGLLLLKSSSKKL